MQGQKAPEAYGQYGEQKRPHEASCGESHDEKRQSETDSGPPGGNSAPQPRKEFVQRHGVQRCQRGIGGGHDQNPGFDQQQSEPGDHAAQHFTGQKAHTVGELHSRKQPPQRPGNQCGGWQDGKTCGSQYCGGNSARKIGHDSCQKKKDAQRGRGIRPAESHREPPTQGEEQGAEHSRGKGQRKGMAGEKNSRPRRQCQHRQRKAGVKQMPSADDASQQIHPRLPQKIPLGIQNSGHTGGRFRLNGHRLGRSRGGLRDRFLGDQIVELYVINAGFRNGRSADESRRSALGAARFAPAQPRR
jgi:hypothetical protein